MAAQAQHRQPLADFRLSVDGVDFTAKARPRLVSLGLTEKRGGEADQLDLVLDDSDGKLSIPRKGALITLALGWSRGSGVPVGLVEKGRFTVDETSWSGPPDQLSIRARSADLTGDFRVRQTRSWSGTTLGAVVRQIAADNGLSPRVDPSLAAIELTQLAQHQESDTALLRRLGREHDAVATVKNRTLVFAPIGKGQTSGGTTLPGLTLTRASGDRYQLGQIDRGAENGVEALWRDRASATTRRVTVGGGSGKPRRLRRIYHSEAEAQAAARAQSGRASRAEASFELTLALGRPDLYPERPVTLSGFKAEADALSWIVAEVRHQLDATGGLGTQLKLETRA